MADYDTYSGLDFDNPIIATELEPKKITEEAILQLINHIKLEYQPDGTVDPASDGPVKGKAVWQALRDAMLKKTVIYTDEVTKSHEALFDQDTEIDVTNYVYSIDETTLEGDFVKRVALDVQFVPNLYNDLRWGVPHFQGRTFTLYLSGDNEDDYRDLNGSRCDLIYERSYGGPKFTGERDTDLWLHHRFCHLEEIGDRYFLVLEKMQNNTTTAIQTDISFGHDPVTSCGNSLWKDVPAASKERVLNWCGYLKIRKIILSKGLI